MIIMKLADRLWDGEVVSYIAKIHECKGRQELFTRQKPVELERLIEIARVQSTEASNKIEGIVTTSTRIKQLMNEKQHLNHEMKVKLLDIVMYLIPFMRVMISYQLEQHIFYNYIVIC